MLRFQLKGPSEKFIYKFIIAKYCLQNVAKSKQKVRKKRYERIYTKELQHRTKREVEKKIIWNVVISTI